MLYCMQGPRSIRLGLGDFVFYSVLVSRAALFGLATLTACFVAVIMVSGEWAGDMLPCMANQHCSSSPLFVTGFGWDSAATWNLQEGPARTAHLHCPWSHLLLYHPPHPLPHGGCTRHKGCECVVDWLLLRRQCVLFFLAVQQSSPT